MFAGCHSGQAVSGSQEKAAELVLNGRVLDLPEGRANEISGKVVAMLAECDDFYELLVTDNLIASLKDKNEYLEILLPEEVTVKTEKFGEMKLSRLMVPLSGRYAANDRITFFSGSGDYSNTPVSRSTGLEELRGMVGKE